jgi:putative endopeptidase
MPRLSRSARSSWLAVAALLLAACSSKPAPQKSDPAARARAPGSPAPVTPAPPAGIDLGAIDRAVAPGDNFFAHANGGWLARTEIPADRAAYGTFAIVGELTAKRTASLTQEAAVGAAPGTDARKVGDFYASYMDEAAIEARGTAPLQPALDAIAAVTSAAGLATLLGGNLRADVDAFNNTDHHTDNVLGLWVAADLAEPKRYTAFLLQGGLGLPGRDYYVDPSPRMAEIRAKYLAHVAALLALAGVSDGPARDIRRVQG